VDVGEAAVDGRLTVGRGDSVTRTAGILWMLATSEAWSGLVDREVPVLDTIVLDFWLPWWVEILTLSVVTRSASEEILGGGTWHPLRCSSASALAAMRCEEYGASWGRRAETQMRETRGGAWRNDDPGGLNTRYSRGEFTRPDCSVTYNALRQVHRAAVPYQGLPDKIFFCCLSTSSQLCCPGRSRSLCKDPSTQLNSFYLLSRFILS